MVSRETSYVCFAARLEMKFECKNYYLLYKKLPENAVKSYDFVSVLANGAFFIMKEISS